MGPLPFIAASALTTIGSMISGWSQGKAQEAQMNAQINAAREQTAAQGRQQSLGLASSLAYNKYDRENARIGQKRNQSFLTNAISRMNYTKRPEWYQTPTPTAIRQSAQELDPQSWNYQQQKSGGGGLGTAGTVGLGLGALAASAVGGGLSAWAMGRK